MAALSSTMAYLAYVATKLRDKWSPSPELQSVILGYTRVLIDNEVPYSRFLQMDDTSMLVQKFINWFRKTEKYPLLAGNQAQIT